MIGFDRDEDIIDVSSDPGMPASSFHIMRTTAVLYQVAGGADMDFWAFPVVDQGKL